MLLSEQQTKYYLDEMIIHYGNKKQDAVTSEAEHKQKAFEDMKFVLFGDDDYGYTRQQKQA